MLRKCIFVIINFFGFSLALMAQQVVTGQITDAEDGNPVPDVSISIANTTVGTTSDESGNYSVTVPGRGAFEIVISHVGYQSVFHKIDMPQDAHQYDVALEIYELEGITISARNNYRRKDVNLFWEKILGERPSKRGMEVLNQEKVNYYLSSDNVLKVSCQEPIEIMNHNMGYLIRYTLASFQHDYKIEQTAFYGTPYFEELIPQNNLQKDRWIKKRQESYAVSLTHFMRALYRKQIHEAGFLLLKKESLNAKTTPLPVLLEDILETNHEVVLVDIDEPLSLICYSKAVTDQMIKNSYVDIFVSGATLQGSSGNVSVNRSTSTTFPVLELKPQQLLIYSDGTFKGMLKAYERRGNFFGLSSMVPAEYAK